MHLRGRISCLDQHHHSKVQNFVTRTRGLTSICPSATDTEAEDQEQKGKKNAEEPDQECSAGIVINDKCRS
jgi:hypothetical protein